jgi:hypothetical protein
VCDVEGVFLIQDSASQSGHPSCIASVDAALSAVLIPALKYTRCIFDEINGCLSVFVHCIVPGSAICNVF